MSYKEYLVLASCCVASIALPITASVYFLKNKKRLLNPTYHPLEGILEPLYFGVAWPYELAIKKGFIAPLGPTPEERELQRQKVIKLKLEQREKRKAPFIVKAKIKEKEIRKYLLGDK